MTITRTPHRWKAIIASRAGATEEVEVHSYWSPDFGGTSEAIALAAAAERNVFKDRERGPNGEVPWLPVSATLIEG